MKKTILLALIVSVLINACNKGPHITPGEQYLNLAAPSGITIAKSVTHLKTKATKVVFDKYGTGTNFEILAIEYFPVPKGYAASVYYRLPDGSTDSYLAIGGIAYRLIETGVQFLPNEPLSEREVDADGGVKCEKPSTCATECKQSTVYNADTQQAVITCSGCDGKCKKKEI